MAVIDDLLGNGLKGNIVTGLAIGIGTIVLAPVVIPVLAGVTKPLAKAAIKGGIILFEKGREAFAEVGEVMEDLVAEAKSEMQQMAEAQKEASSVVVPKVEEVA